MDVVWTKGALQDLAEIQDYIALESPLTAFRFTNDLKARTDILRDFPSMGRPGRVAGTRELIVSKTDYIVAYRVSARVEILAFINAAKEWPEFF